MFCVLWQFSGDRILNIQPVAGWLLYLLSCSEPYKQIKIKNIIVS
jgi:hypothetical protein